MKMTCVPRWDPQVACSPGNSEPGFASCGSGSMRQVLAFAAGLSEKRARIPVGVESVPR